METEVNNFRRRFLKKDNSINSDDTSTRIREKDSDDLKILDDSSNWWLEFNDSNTQQSYEEFRSSEFSIIQYLVIAIFFTILTFYSLVMKALYFLNDNPIGNLNINYISTGVSIAFLIFVIIPLWIIVCCRSMLRNRNDILISLEFSVLIGGSIAIGVNTVTMGFLSVQCEPAFANAAIFLTIFPSMMTTMFRYTNLKLHFLSWFISFILLIIALSVSKGQIGIALIFISCLLAYQGYYMEFRTLSYYKNTITKTQLSYTLEKIEALKDSKFVDDLRHMIGNVAHDLKTPTQSFSVCLEQLENSITVAIQSLNISNYKIVLKTILNEMSDNVLQLKASNTFMSMMINRTIDFTKASHGNTLCPRMTTVDIMEALAWPLNCIKCMQDKIPIVLEVLPDVCTRIITDFQWLQENTLCLLSNAVKYSHSGQIYMRVMLPTGFSGCQQQADDHQGKYEESGQMIRFEVEDQGIGVPEEKRQQLFAPFKDAQRLAGGTGLGLYSMMKRMEALKGTCGVQGRPDGQEGSLFWFEIPYRPDITNIARSRSDSSSSCIFPIPIPYPTFTSTVYSSAEEKLNIVKLPTQTDTDTDTKSNLKVLLVDDSLPILKTLGMALKKEGHSVQTASNGAEALIYLINKQEEFDFVIMDLQMPVMDGIEAVRRLRAYESSELLLEEQYELPFHSKNKKHNIIIGSSANSDDVTRKEALEVGMDDFLPKPYPISVLMKLVDVVITRQKIDCNI